MHTHAHTYTHIHTHIHTHLVQFVGKLRELDLLGGRYITAAQQAKEINSKAKEVDKLLKQYQTQPPLCQWSNFSWAYRYAKSNQQNQQPAGPYTCPLSALLDQLCRLY